MHRAVLTSALNAAVNARLLREERKNVAQRATNKPRIRLTEDTVNNVWTADEASRFVEHLKASGNKQYTALFALALDSGCRRNELLGLQWRDLEGSTLRVERQLLTGGRNAPTFSLPKSGRVRRFDLAEPTLALLAAHKREQAEVKMANRTRYADNGLVFAQEWGSSNTRHAMLGAPLRWTSLIKRLDALCTESGVRRITMHGLRHTCATLALSTGVSPQVVQRRLGHAQVVMTLGIYGHVLPGQQADLASRVAKLVHGKRQSKKNLINETKRGCTNPYSRITATAETTVNHTNRKEP